MNWMIPEELKKRVSYAQFSAFYHRACGSVCSILDNYENNA